MSQSLQEFSRENEKIIIFININAEKKRKIIPKIILFFLRRKIIKSNIPIKLVKIIIKIKDKLKLINPW